MMQHERDLTQRLPQAVVEVRDRHLAFFTDMARRIKERRDDPTLPSSESAAMSDAMEAEIDNFRAALEWALVAERVEEGLELMWYACGPFYRDPAEGLSWADRLLAVEGGSALARARVCVVAAELAQFSGRFDVELDRAQEGLRLFQEAGDAVWTAIMTRFVGTIYWNSANAAESLRYHGRAAELFRQLGDQAPAYQTAEALRAFGWAMLRAGDRDALLRQCDEALEVLQSRGTKRELALHYSIHSNAYFNTGDVTAFRRLLAESLRLWREADDPFGLANALTTVALVQWEQGDPDGAEALYTEALELCQIEDGRPAGPLAALDLQAASGVRADALWGLALVSLTHHGDAAHARSLVSEALVQLGESGPPMNLTAQTRIRLQQWRLKISRLAGDLDAARRAAREAIVASTWFPGPFITADARSLAAVLEDDLGNHEAARVLHEEAVAVIEGVDDTLFGAIRMRIIAAHRRSTQGLSSAIGVLQDWLASSADALPHHGSNIRLLLGAFLIEAGDYAAARDALEAPVASAAAAATTLTALRHARHAAACAALGDGAAADASLQALGTNWTALVDAQDRALLLETLAARAPERGDAQLAARLLGAAAAFRELTSAPASDAARGGTERVAALARDALGEEAFDRARASGAGTHEDLLGELLGRPERA